VSLYDDFPPTSAADHGVAGTPRVRIILKNSLQWRTWIAQVETIAQSLDVWRYIDPTIPEDKQVNPPARPDRPNKQDAKYAKDATSGRLTRDAQTDFGYDRKDYDDDMVEYRTIRLSLDKISERIRNTLAVELQSLTVEERDTRKLLQALRARFSYTDKVRVQLVRRQWNELLLTPVKDTGIDAWL